MTAITDNHRKQIEGYMRKAMGMSSTETYTITIEIEHDKAMGYIPEMVPKLIREFGTIMRVKLMLVSPDSAVKVRAEREAYGNAAGPTGYLQETFDIFPVETVEHNNGE